MERSTERMKEVEATILDKVGEAISAVKIAKNVDQVICALHSLAVLLFPLDSSLLSDCIDECYRDQVLSAEVASANEREERWRVFYRGAAFPALARVLLFDVASSWLACFPISARKQVYDVFFVDGLATEVVQTLVPCLQLKGSNNDLDINVVQLNTERLLILHLLENNGVLQIANSFDSYFQSDNVMNEQFKADVSRVAQIIISIPDKIQLKSPTSLSSHLFFKKIIHQVLFGAEEMENLNESKMDCYLLFCGEIFSRICRRGSTDVLLNEVVPRVLKHVRTLISSNTDSVLKDLVMSNRRSQYWLKIMETIRDPYAVEKMTEELLNRLATEHANDIEAYWTLWILFHCIISHQTSVRFMFVDKFLLWKVFPIQCLRWILQFAVLECPPNDVAVERLHDNRCLLDTAQRLAAVWCKKEFVQSASVEQQVYLTAALGLSLEKMSREELDETKDVMQSILQGVSCRLENPTHLVRKMASSIALVFSKVIDPKNPLYLDDCCTEETISWDFGLNNSEKGLVAASKSAEQGTDKSSTSLVLEEHSNPSDGNDINNSMKGKHKKSPEFKLLDPDEIIDPATLNNGSESDEDDTDVVSANSDSSSDSSLQPYDLSDDDTDLRNNLSQLVDVATALRKSDDADGVERALDVAEKLVRAYPDELKHIAGDLVRTLVQVRCSDLAIEGEEESAEGKRQKALVALVSTCPVESLDTLNKLLYSPNVDVSQRIMILDIMTDAAQELADAKTMKPKHQQSVLISTTSESQPWFLPSSTGPPGAGSWKEVPTTGTLLNWSNAYERDLPLRASQIKKGKTRRWSLRSANTQQSQVEWSHNKFPLYAAAFMLPAMQGFDKKRHGVDMLGRDFIVLGKLIYMLGVCMKCAAKHPEASTLASPLLNMLRSREVCHHKEAYVRRAVLFAASCILVALHPSYVASALVEGNLEISRGLEWVRTFSLHVAESDTDRECYTMAVMCLQLHAEMALQASRAFETAETTFKAKSIDLSSKPSKDTIKIPRTSLNLKF